jgi:N-alpha-acetyltransferase 30
MLAVSPQYRGRGIATALVRRGIDAMASRNADEVNLTKSRLGTPCFSLIEKLTACPDQIVLETEASNTTAIRLYERLGFLRSKKLHRYYLNGNSAFRLVLLLRTVDPDSSADLSLD